VSEPTLAQAREKFSKDIWVEPVNCPCCGRFSMVAHWSVNSGQWKFLVELATRGGRRMAWVKAQDVYHSLRNEEGQNGASAYSPLKHFGLVEKLDDFDPDLKKAEREKGNKGTGLWRATPLGWAFILGQARIPKIVWTFDDRVLKRSSEVVGRGDVQGDGFDFNEALRGAISVAPEEFSHPGQMALF
jgi:hypothetical protein